MAVRNKISQAALVAALRERYGGSAHVQADGDGLTAYVSGAAGTLCLEIGGPDSAILRFGLGLGQVVGTSPSEETTEG